MKIPSGTFILGVCALLFLPVEAHAQKPARLPLVGVVLNSPPTRELAMPVPVSRGASAFVEGMAERGWIDGRNVRIVLRSAESVPGRVPALIDELLKLKVDVIVTSGTTIAQAAQEKTRTIPIVMASSGFPVENGLVQSLARPGGNVTGLTSVASAGLDGKRLALLKQVAPRVSRVAFLIPSYTTSVPEPTHAAARALGVMIFLAPYVAADSLESAFTQAMRQGANGVLVSANPVTFVDENQLLLQRLALQHRVPVVYSTLIGAKLGGLMTYANDEWGQFRRAAHYVDRILKGADPAELPIEQPAQFRLEVNLKAAKALGLTFPASIMTQADRVFE